MTVRATFQCVVSRDQHRVRPELHFVFNYDSTPGVNPTTGGDVNVTANFQAIREVNRYSPRNLEIYSTGFEAGTEEESSRTHDWPNIGQPIASDCNYMEPEIFQ